MNPLSSLPENCDEPAWNRLIQQCADGELDECAERELLARLEFQPAGWRQLALALVEGRLLRRVCGEWMRECAGPPPRVAPARLRPAWWRSAAQMAAAVLVGLTAFAVGRWSVPPPEPERTPSVVAVDFQSDPRSAPPAGDHSPPAGAQRSVEPTPAGAAASRAAAVSREGLPTPVTYVGLLVPGSDAAIEVPIYRASESLAEWQPFEQPVLSPEEAEALRKAGYHVEWQRELLTLTSTEGEPILLPLESVRVEPSRY